MDINYFKEFTVLAQTKNFWAASEQLFINQSTLSKHIKSMEEHFGADLFARTSRKVELTEFGRLILPYAQQIADLQYEYESAALHYNKKGKSTLTIGTIPVIPKYNITEQLVRFQLEYPSIDLKTVEADTMELRERLLRRECDIIFYRNHPFYLEHDPDRESLMAQIPFASDDLVAVLPKDHPLAGETTLRLEQLKEEYFATIPEETMPYNLCIRACRDAGFTPTVIFRSHNLEAILDMVRKGHCVALLFEQHVRAPFDSLSDLESRKVLDAPHAVIPIEPAIRTDIVLAYLKKPVPSPAAIHFIDSFLREHPQET